MKEELRMYLKNADFVELCQKNTFYRKTAPLLTLSIRFSTVWFSSSKDFHVLHGNVSLTNITLPRF